MAFADARQFLVYVGGISGTFNKMTGGKKSAPSAEAYDGGNPEPQIVTGNTKIDNVVVTRTFDPNRDGPIFASLKSQVSKFTTTITQVYTDANYVPVGGSDQWTGTLIEIQGPMLDASKSGATPAELVLTFACSTLR